MTEEQWLSSSDPLAMLGFLATKASQTPSERKMRLFGCACLRRIADLLTHEECLRALDAAEQFADGAIDVDRLRLAQTVVDRLRASVEDEPVIAAIDPARILADPIAAIDAARSLADSTYFSAQFVVARIVGIRRFSAAEERCAQASLLRDIIGSPFHTVPFDRKRLTPAIGRLVASAYSERELPSGHLDPMRLAILADALEEAGIGGEVVEHLRSLGPHVRGCWALTRCS